MTTIYGGYTAREIEAQYNLRAGRPDYDTAVVPAWIDRSAAARASLDCRLDVPYGDGPRQRLDVFPAAGPAAPTLVYFHGGYWQRGDRSVYSFLAVPFVRHGVNVVVAGYDLCPTVSITAISRQARDAMAFLWRKGRDVGVAPDRLVAMGHSAGGHITAMLMGTGWPGFGAGLPADLVKAGIQISPLNLLEPLRFTSINDALGMDAAEAASQSPMNNPPATDAPQLVVCGARETAEFHRQSDMYVDAFATPDRLIERYSVPDADHFDELDILASDNSVFFAKALSLVTSPT